MIILRIILICIVCLCVQCVLFAQEEGKALLRIEQTFDGWVDCSSHTPKWSSSRLTIGEKNYYFDSGNDCKDIISTVYVGSSDRYYCKLKFELTVKEMEHDKSWKIDLWEISPGADNRDSKSASERCGGIGSKKEGWTATLSVVFDDPIDVKRTSNTPIAIEKDNLKLEFSDFYDNGENRILQYRCNNASDKSWMDATKQPNIISGGKAELSYEDVVGKFTNDNKRYTDCTGKTIEFRVVKTLLDGSTRTYGKTASAIFYHQGPEFSFNSIRRVECVGGPGLSISVKLTDPKNIGIYLNNPDVFNWVLEHYPKAKTFDETSQTMKDENGEEAKTSSIFYLTSSNISSNGDMVLVGEDKNDSNFKLSNYLNENADPKADPSVGLWLLQLQYVESYKKETEGLYFTTHWLKIPSSIDKMAITHEIGTCRTDDNYSIVSKHNPEINVKFDDKDWQNRMGYYIYQFDDGTSSIWYNNSSDKEKASAFETNKQKSHPKYSISKEQHGSSGIYSVQGLNVNKEVKERYFYVQDNDKCIYEVKYKALQKDFSTTPASGSQFDLTLTSGKSPSEATYSTTLKYDGGAFPYFYNGKWWQPKEAITMENLKFRTGNGEISGKNTIKLKGKDGHEETVEITIPFVKPTFNAVAQTCSVPKHNGKIFLNAPGTFTPIKYKINNIESKNGNFVGLEAGKYQVTCYYSDGCSTIVDVNVPENIFTIDEVSDIFLPDFDKTATITLELRNYSSLTWEKNDIYNISDANQHTLFSGTYKYKVTNHSNITNDQCVVDGGFNITAPHAEVGLRVETYADGDGYNIKTSVTKNEITKSDEISKTIKYYTVLNSKSESIDTQRAYSSKDGCLTFIAKYNVGGNEQTYKVGQADGISPILLNDNQETYFKVDGMPQPKCHNETVTWTLADGYEACIKGSNTWGKSIYLEQGKNEVTIRKKEVIGLGKSIDFVATVENIGYRDLTIDIRTIPYISIGKIENPVSCFDGNDGSVEIFVSPQYEWKTYLYEIIKGDISSQTTRLEGIPSGKGSIKVTDKQCNYSQSSEFTIERPKEKLTIEASTIQPSCHDDGGVVTVNVNGGWNTYKEYLDGDLWYDAVNPNETKTFNSLVEGEHTIQVVDNRGCKQAFSTTINPYKNPYVSSAISDFTSCFGLSDGEISNIEVKTNGQLNGNDVYIEKVFYSFTPQDKELYKASEDNARIWDGKIDNLAAGSYKLWVEDNNGCKTEGGKEYQVTIAEPEPLKVEARLLDGGRILYKGGSEGRMEVKGSGGNVGIDSVFYNNSNVLVSTGVPYIVGGMSAGSISITASDRYNCPCNDTTLTFIEPEEPITIEAESQAALCHAMTGSVKVTATGGWGDHRIRLVGNSESRNSGEQSETTFESLYAGDYEIEVEDKHGAKATQRVRIDAPEPISHELITTPDHCDGNGSVTIKLSGGMPDYTTIFVVGTDTTKIAGSTINIGNLVGGREYELHTRDANTCESVIAFPQPDNRLKAEIKYAYNADGSATLTAEVKGGIAPYTYKWRNVSGGEELGTSSTQTVTKSGIYRLEIADASGCSYKTMQPVLMVGSIAMRVKAVTRTTNPNNNDGTATIECTATQSANLRMYHLETDTWTTIQNATTTINLEGLQWGHYCVEGELDNGNMQTAMFFIAPYEPMEVTKIDVKHVSAPGRNDASVVVDFEGGIAPYVLNSATYPTGHIELENLAAGKITLSIADSTGNILTKDVEILEPKQPLVVTPSRVDSASCFSYSDGSVQLTATGGWPGYQFANGNGDYRNSAYFGGLNAGERIFKVVDKYGVEDSVKVTVSEPDMLRASVAAIDSVKCHDDNNGAAHFTVTGGTAPYRTIYEKETLDGTDVAHLLSGSYVMKFTDSHQCKSPDTISIYIPEPDLLELANDYVTHTTCELDNGKIAIEVKGGSLPYRYEWKENGATYNGAKTINMSRSEAENLKQNGLYNIDIIDLHGCHTQYEMRIEHSENPRVLGVATTDVLCYGSSDGVATVDSSQVKYGYPKANYHLTWPQGQTGVMTVNTLPTGTYLVRITDDNNCTTTREFTVGTPEPVKSHLSGLRDALCFGYSDGRIETHTTGGVGNYTYAWSTGETTSYAENLRAGTYTVVVADSHECNDTATYEVGEPEELKVNLGDDVLICPGNVHVFDAGEYATYSWSSVAKGEEIETERYLATGEEGDYAIKVTDEIGCIARDTVNLRIGENALHANFLMASDAAVNDTIVLIELSNMPVDSVRWQYDKLMTVDVEEAEEYMFPLMAESTGRYYITMWAYSGGCESFEQKFIDIYEAVEDTSDFKIGYDPLIKQAKVSPNPNDGEFDLIVVLREKADVDVTVHDVNNGRQVEHVVLKDSDKYNTRFNIRQWGSGIFVLSVVSGKERRAIKVLCVK